MKRTVLGTIFFFAIQLTISVHAESFYKYTDENGKVRYTNVAPSKAKKVEKKELPKQQQVYENNSLDSSTSKAPASSYSKGSKYTSKSSGQSSNQQERKAICQKGVREGLDTIESQLGVMKKNMQGGYITKAEYNKGKNLLNRIKGNLSVRDCMQSSGKERKLYKCLANTYGDVLGCIGKQK